MASSCIRHEEPSSRQSGPRRFGGFAARLCAGLLTAASAGTPAFRVPDWLPDADGERFRVDPDSGRILDSKNRERLFHGTNVVFKKFPFHPEVHGGRSKWSATQSFTEDDMSLLASLGFNTIRLNTPWAAVEPYPVEPYPSSSGRDRSRPASYNDTFLDVVETIVDTML